jgi:hypothetical protein
MLKNSNLPEIKAAKAVIKKINDIQSAYLIINTMMNDKYPTCDKIFTVRIEIPSFPFNYDGVQIVVQSKVKVVGYLTVIDSDLIKIEKINKELSSDVGIDVVEYEYDIEKTYRNVCSLIEEKGKTLIHNYMDWEKEEEEKKCKKTEQT